MSESSKLVTTILCGGAGSRLWPLSRSEHPKPFIKLQDNKSLLQKSVERAVATTPDELMVVTNEALLFKVDDDIHEVKSTDLPKHYLLEPFPKNTAAAVAASVVETCETHGDDTVILVLSADHLFADEAAFQQAVVEARLLAAKNYIVTFGIQPDRPETGFGYLEVDGHRVKRFTEKPAVEEAEVFLSTGNYFWNGGMFCFRAGVMRNEMATHCPDILHATEVALSNAKNTHFNHTRVTRLSPEDFAAAPDTSIDYAVMERTLIAAVVTCDIGWRDVGSWDAMSELHDADGDGNVIQSEVCLHNASNSFFYSDDRLIAAVGIDNLIIVDTADALLVADKRNSQQIREIYQSLKHQNHDAHRHHNMVFRPWGNYTVLDVAEHFKIKRIEVKPGASLSLQTHRHRSEHWVVIEGRAKVINDQDELLIDKNESTFIQAGHRHRLSNPFETRLVIIEVQTGEYVGEDDIIRHDDIYGRLTN